MRLFHLIFSNSDVLSLCIFVISYNTRARIVEFVWKRSSKARSKKKRLQLGTAGNCIIFMIKCMANRFKAINLNIYNSLYGLNWMKMLNSWLTKQTARTGAANVQIKLLANETQHLFIKENKHKLNNRIMLPTEYIRLLNNAWFKMNRVQGRSLGSPRVPVTPLCKPFCKQTTYNRWRKRHNNPASTVILAQCDSPLKNPGYAPGIALITGTSS